MRIGDFTNWRPVGPGPNSGSATGASTSSAETGRIRTNVDNARSTALSALTNDRFSSMLKQITAPAFSDALMQMGSGSSIISPGLRSAQASYAENSD